MTCSALTGAGTEAVMPAVLAAFDAWTKRVPTAALNRWLEQAAEHHPPPLARPLVALSRVDALAALEGTLLMELGKIQRVNQIAERHPLPESLGEASLGAILFHSRLRSRTGDLAGARALLVSGLEANESRRPLSWLRLSLELVRLARRNDDPQTELAQRARSRAEKLGLTGLAPEFLPFCAP